MPHISSGSFEPRPAGKLRQNSLPRGGGPFRASRADDPAATGFLRSASDRWEAPQAGLAIADYFGMLPRRCKSPEWPQAIPSSRSVQ